MYKYCLSVSLLLPASGTIYTADSGTPEQALLLANLHAKQNNHGFAAMWFAELAIRTYIDGRCYHDPCFVNTSEILMRMGWSAGRVEKLKQKVSPDLVQLLCQKQITQIQKRLDQDTLSGPHWIVSYRKDFNVPKPRCFEKNMWYIVRKTALAECKQLFESEEFKQSLGKSYKKNC